MQTRTVFPFRQIIGWALGCLAMSGVADAATPADPEGTAMLQAAWQQIAALHAKEPSVRPVLRVVYFVPRDREPLADHVARLDRVMKDIRRSFQDGYRRFGLDADVLPLEEKDGKLVIHEVKGKADAAAYDYASGDRTGAEVRAALKGTIDFEREHVLVLYALCRKEPDGRYVFDSPYYGEASSNHRRGFCHAADCELLDPQLLRKDLSRTMVYTEHYYPRMEQTVAAFNSMYLGGIAHELGHGLGLDHDAGSLAERNFGVSLMGGGNLTYRRDVWGGEPSSYLSRATALQLLSHPLFSHGDRGRWDNARGHFKSLAFTDGKNALEITGTATGKIAPYAVIARVWPTTARTDHGAQSFPAVLTNGAFQLTLPRVAARSNRLSLTILHANGETWSELLEWKVDRLGKSNLSELNSEWLVDRAEIAVVEGDPQARAFLGDDSLAAVTLPEAGRKLRVLRGVLDPAVPVELAMVKENQQALSDAAWTEANVGWGKVTRNSFWFDPQNPHGVFLLVAGKFHDKGLYAHAPAKHVFPLQGNWKTFTATAGLQDGAGPIGSAIFTVLGDGKVLHRSRLLRDGQSEAIRVEVAGITELRLETQGGEDHNHRSWAIWAAPTVLR